MTAGLHPIPDADGPVDGQLVAQLALDPDDLTRRHAVAWTTGADGLDSYRRAAVRLEPRGTAFHLLAYDHDPDESVLVVASVTPDLPAALDELLDALDVPEGAVLGRDRRSLAWRAVAPVDQGAPAPRVRTRPAEIPARTSLLMIVRDSRATAAVEQLVVDLYDDRFDGYEIVAVAYDSLTLGRLAHIAERSPSVRVHEHAVGGSDANALRAGLERARGDRVIVLGDAEDVVDISDILRYGELLDRGYDCVFGFGGRLARGRLERVIDWLLRIAFRHGYAATLQPFKAYRREVIDAVGPLVASGAGWRAELPLKAIVRGFSYGIAGLTGAPTNRADRLRSRDVRDVLGVALYVWVEHRLSRGDYRRPGAALRRRRLSPLADDGMAETSPTLERQRR